MEENQIDNEQKKRSVFKLSQDGNKTISSIHIQMNKKKFNKLIPNIKEAFKVLPWHISNVDNYYEVVGLFLILYTNIDRSNVKVVFKFKFNPENKLNREYAAIAVILQILSNYEYEMKECIYYNDVKSTYINYLFNTRKTHMRSFNIK